MLSWYVGTMQVPSWKLVALIGVSVISIVILTVRPMAQTATRERRAVRGERTRRAALATIKPPPVPEALTGHADPGVLEALADYKAGRYDIASTKFHYFTSKDPANADLQLLLGACYLLTHDVEPGIRELKVAVSLAPERAERARILLAKAYIDRGSDAEATIQLERVLDSRGPLEEEAREILGGLQQLR
jgi:predicted Zn-dependent protease